jgi:hypothetical protein
VEWGRKKEGKKRNRDQRWRDHRFHCPRSSDNRLCAEAAAPLSSTISVTKVRRESKNRDKRPKKRGETQAKQGERKGAFLWYWETEEKPSLECERKKRIQSRE